MLTQASRVFGGKIEYILTQVSRVLGGKTFPPGIVYYDFEVMELHMGPSKDTVTVLGTHVYVGAVIEL